MGHEFDQEVWACVCVWMLGGIDRLGLTEIGYGRKTGRFLLSGAGKRKVRSRHCSSAPPQLMVCRWRLPFKVSPTHTWPTSPQGLSRSSKIRPSSAQVWSNPKPKLDRAHPLSLVDPAPSLAKLGPNLAESNPHPGQIHADVGFSPKMAGLTPKRGRLRPDFSRIHLRCLADGVWGPPLE